MATLPSTFQAHLGEMEDTRQRLLQRLQAEKELHSRKNLQLSKQREMLARVKHRCFMLKQKDAEICMNVFEKEEEMQASAKALADLNVKKCSLQSELSELERRKQERLQYYEQKKSTMVLHQAKLQEDISKLQAEVKKLRNTFHELQGHFIQVQDPSPAISSLNAEIGREEQNQNVILAQLNTLKAQEAKSASFKVELEQRVEQARKEENDHKASLEKQRLEIMELQMENQSLENRVLEAMQFRDQRKRFGFGSYIRNKS